MKEWASKLDLSILSKKIKEKIGWVHCKSNKIIKAIGIYCRMRKLLKITKSDLISVDASKKRPPYVAIIISK
jgi:hypothetical protein